MVYLTKDNSTCMKTIQRRAHIRDFLYFPVITVQLFAQQEGTPTGNIWRILVTLLKRERLLAGKRVEGRIVKRMTMTICDVDWIQVPQDRSKR
jgi:hypothetical protein